MRVPGLELLTRDQVIRVLLTRGRVIRVLLTRGRVTTGVITDARACRDVLVLRDQHGCRAAGGDVPVWIKVAGQGYREERYRCAW